MIGWGLVLASQSAFATPRWVPQVDVLPLKSWHQHLDGTSGFLFWAGENREGGATVVVLDPEGNPHQRFDAARADSMGAASTTTTTERRATMKRADRPEKKRSDDRGILARLSNHRTLQVS